MSNDPNPRTSPGGAPPRIREAAPADVDAVLAIERRAFGHDKEAELVRTLLADPSAAPRLSLLAFRNTAPVGHILFTRARLTSPESTAPIALLAPLAVLPEAQRQGIGGRLIEAGLQRLARAGVDLVFVLGHPHYYPRHGFQPAGCLGFEAPYPIPAAHAGAWMVQGLRAGALDAGRGKVMCADSLDRPEHWRE